MPIWIGILLATAAAFWVGAKRSKWRERFFRCSMIAVLAWTGRFALIAFAPEDVTISEYYINEMSFGVATAEIAAIGLWFVVFSYVGTLVAKFWPGQSNNT